MKAVLFLSLLFCALSGDSQSIRYLGETIYASNKAFALLRQTHIIPKTYAIETLNNDELIRIYPGKTHIKGRPCYIITFVNDGRQAMLPDSKDFINKLVREIVKAEMIKDNAVNTSAEELFIKAHPMPKGYEDVEQTRDFGEYFKVAEPMY